MTAFAAFLGEKVERYIDLRRSLGYAFDKQAGTLRVFVHYVERVELDAPATRTMALDFVLSFGGAANSRAVRHGVLRRFYEYLAFYDPRTEALERRAFTRSRAIPPPRILNETELASLIDACSLISPRVPLRCSTMAMLVGLLASTGLRSGEVLRLDRGDVDLTDGVVLVRKTKFRKDRLVPVHPRPAWPFVGTPASATPCFPHPRTKPSFSAHEAAVCRPPACKAILPRPGSLRASMMASPCGRTISAIGSR